MAATIVEILTNLRDTLVAAGIFDAVSLGGDPATARWPRAELLAVRVHQRPADDSPSGRWSCLCARVRILVRSQDSSEALKRAVELAEASQSAIMADPYRGQHCRDLPIGKATEVGTIDLEPHVRAPAAEVAFAVRCHFEPQGEA